MSLLNPTYLWALLGLLIPVAIHLWNKREAHIIKVGSIKNLENLTATQRSAIRFNELWLLMLRMLAIIVLTLILAEPRIINDQDTSEVIFIVEPSLLGNERLVKTLDSLKRNPIRLLKKGFPLYDPQNQQVNSDLQNIRKNESMHYWQLAQQMQELPSDSIVVFTNALLSGIHGMRPKINKKIKWIIVDSDKNVNRIVEAKIKGQHLRLLHVSGSTEKLKFTTDSLQINADKFTMNPAGDSITIPATDKIQKLHVDTLKTLNVNIVYDVAFRSEKRYIEAAINALSSYLLRPIHINTSQHIDSLPNAEPDLLVWLKEGSAPDYTSQKVLRYDSIDLSKNSNSIVTESLQNPHLFYLTARLNSENSIKENLPEKLLQLFDLHPRLDQIIAPFDNRQIDKKELETKYTPAHNTQNYASVLNLTPWLLALLGLLLIIERTLSKYRNQ